MPIPRADVLAVKQRLARERENLFERHRAGCSGSEMCLAFSRLRDAAVVELAESALADLNETGAGRLRQQTALVAHGGYGRRDTAPYSDVDLMILHRPRTAARVALFAKRLVQSLFDAGLAVGHSMRTPKQACRLAAGDASICTSLIDSRLICGNRSLFSIYDGQFRRQARRRSRRLLTLIEQQRASERLRYGDTVFLLEPNVKRSPGTLRDIQWLGWMGFVRHGTADLCRLPAEGFLNNEDLSTVLAAKEYLLWLRNELHFHAGRASDVLDRAEQIRIAALRGHPGESGLLPVEQFMREYFRHTDAVSHITAHCAEAAQSSHHLDRLATLLFGRRVENGLCIGPAGILATRRGRQRLQGNVTAILRVVELSGLHDKPLSAATGEAIRLAALRLPKDQPTADAYRHFLSLLDCPGRLGPSLRCLHSVRLLERFLPAFGHARGLLQFNQYHKYTVDEHCLRAVEFAASLVADRGPLGRVYRPLMSKRLLHLALLIHDLGKGYAEDHCEVGWRIAVDAAARLALPAHEAETLEFLVQRHTLLSRLALRRDTADEQLAVQLAVQVGSPEVLHMLYLLTAADLAAVGPGVWDGWKAELVTDLYHRTMQYLAGDSPETTAEGALARRRSAVQAWLGGRRNDPWFVEHLAALPVAYFNATPPQQVAADLQLLRDLEPGGVTVVSQYQCETDVIQFTIATSERVVTGIFHRLAGALSSRGLEIRTAQIHTLPDGLVLDRFWVHDPDYSGQQPLHRFEEIAESLRGALKNPSDQSPAFRRTWQAASRRPLAVANMPAKVNIDNGTSAEFTIIDVFAHDRPGLLYAITRTLFELGLSVGRAKIATYLDQVVDVFYVTDQCGSKVAEEDKLNAIRRRLLDVR